MSRCMCVNRAGLKQHHQKIDEVYIDGSSIGDCEHDDANQDGGHVNEHGSPAPNCIAKKPKCELAQ